MFLLDTDILIWAIRGREDIVKSVERLVGTKSTCVSTITIAEIYKNIYPSELIVTEDLLSRHIIYPVDYEIARQGGLYWRDYNKKHSGLSLPDCLIASTAKLYDLTLVTMNDKHFPMQGIEVINPLRSN